MIAQILLVDDNAVQAATRRAILSRTGRSVVVASSATEALHLLDDDELFNSINLIITDHWMPGLNGPQFVEKLRDRLPKIPVLVLSGLPNVEAEYDGLNVVFRVKPFPPDQLIALVEAILDEPMSRTA
jgi:DNA-binding response OmpR family regulator